jgi:hypothetical protein
MVIVLSSPIDDGVTACYDVVVVVSIVMLDRLSVTTLKTVTDSACIYVT